LAIAELLIGTWSLVSYDVVAADGTRGQPLGREPAGLLIYGADGFMSALLTGQGNAISYSGSYAVREPDATVVHRVLVSIEPGWLGHDLSRDVRLEDDRLILSTVYRAETHELTWRSMPR
jgi:Lipocalin-like domain